MTSLPNRGPNKNNNNNNKKNGMNDFDIKNNPYIYDYDKMNEEDRDPKELDSDKIQSKFEKQQERFNILGLNISPITIMNNNNVNNDDNNDNNDNNNNNNNNNENNNRGLFSNIYGSISGIMSRFQETGNNFETNSNNDGNNNNNNNNNERRERATFERNSNGGWKHKDGSGTTTTFNYGKNNLNPEKNEKRKWKEQKRQWKKEQRKKEKNNNKKKLFSFSYRNQQRGINTEWDPFNYSSQNNNNNNNDNNNNESENDSTEEDSSSNDIDMRNNNNEA